MPRLVTWKEEEVEKLKAMWLDGESKRSIAKALPYSYWTVNNKINALGLERINKRASKDEPRAEVERIIAFNPKELEAELIDTRSWAWYDWYHYFLNIKLTENQILELEAMDTYMNTLRKIYRRSGKTTIVNFGYILRHLCESIWHEEDRLVYYYTAIEKNLIIMGQSLIDALENNEKILRNYGLLIKDYLVERKGSRRNAKNTITEITLKTQHTPAQANYTSVLLGKKFRGCQNAYKVIIDDPMDSKEIASSHYTLLTDKLEMTLLDRLLPLAKEAKHISMSGTPYGFDDIFIRFEQKAGWHTITRPVATKHNFSDGWHFPKTIPRNKLKPSDIIIHDEAEWEITDPVIWQHLPRDPKATAIQNVIWVYDQMKSSKMGTIGFYKEFLMSIVAMSSVIKFEYFQQVEKLPNHPNFYNWAIFFDDATGESLNADDRALSLVAYDKRAHRFYLVDMLFFRDVGTKKREKIINFWRRNELQYGISIALLIETVMNQMETYTALKEDGIPCRRINPRGRGDKDYRIMNNLLTFLEDGEFYMLKDIRQKDKLQMECLGFGNVHVNMLDSIDQNAFYLNRGYKKVHAKAFELVK